MLPHRAISPRSWPSAEVASLSRSRSDPHFAADPHIESSPDLSEGFLDDLPLNSLAGRTKIRRGVFELCCLEVARGSSSCRSSAERSRTAILVEGSIVASRAMREICPPAYGGQISRVERLHPMPPSAVRGHARRRRRSRKRAAIVEKRNTVRIP